MISADPTFSDFDKRAMARALELAWRGAETTHPNPNVGCVLAQGEQIIAEGWHERAGGPHAEVAALRALAASGGAEASVGCTAYVTLEPCSHHGRTPPCSEALIAARVARVVFALEDPNPSVAGRGAALLRAAGIQVESGLMAAEAEEVNLGFLMRMRHGRPFVRVKMGASLDGRVALANGKSQWITSDAAREDVQRWRARSSAVLTGIGTVLADDPRLNVRLPGASRHPLRVILDSRLRTPANARILDGSAPTLIFTQTGPFTQSGVFSQSGRADVQAALIAKGATIEHVPADEQAAATPGTSAPAGSVSSAQTAGALPGEHSATPASDIRVNPSADAGRSTLNLPAVLARLAALEMNDVLIEAGPTLSGAFVQRGLADELLLYMAPKLLGPDARPLFDLPRLEDLQQARQFRIIDQTLIGPDLRLRLRAA